jgi:RecJ-like exonuclease
MHEICPEKYRICRCCDGNGRIRCPTCKGRHEIIINLNAWDHRLNVPAEEHMTCPNPKCLGRGTIVCPECEGRGYVEREQRPKVSNAELTSEVSQTSEPSLNDLEKDFYSAKYKAVDELRDLLLQGQVRQRFSKTAGKFLEEVLKAPVRPRNRVWRGHVSARDLFRASLRDIDAVTEEINSIDFETPGAEEKAWVLMNKLLEFQDPLPEGNWIRDSLHNAHSAVTGMWHYSRKRKERMQQ